MAELHRAGLNLRNPPIFSRVGIPGSGGPDWLRSDYEWIVSTARPGQLPWSDNTACGHPPKWAPGGEMAHRLTDGTRVNQWGHPIDSGATVVNGDGTVRSEGKRPSHRLQRGNQKGSCAYKMKMKRSKLNGDRGGHTPEGYYEWNYTPPALANPGNIIECLVGGGVMGNDLAHENEAPFPLKLAEFFVRSFCPPGGIVCDPFLGSGTTIHAALEHGRRGVGCDLRQSQVELSRRRLTQVTPAMF
jgi:hypothetical protein